MKMDTYRPLRHLLQDAMTEWLKSKDDNMILNATEYHSNVRSVIILQSHWMATINQWKIWEGVE
jgi:hypothetical protein